ncbi:MAG: lactoylglutathione lyase [Gammaproteobacteria bacterium]|nr:lactoylglutathione lyase [Gammaproteobacteria bacterium]
MDTAGFKLNHSMLRVKDPTKSLDFYQNTMGATLIETFVFDNMGFTLYFLGFDAGLVGQMPPVRAERIEWLANQSGLLELTHNHGTESDDSFEGYHNGNSEPKGFGHICVSVPDVNAACDRFESLGVEFVKRPNDGSMKGIAFVKDPDDYWVEIFAPVDLKNVILEHT